MPTKKAAQPAEEPVRSLAGKPAGSLEARITLRYPIDMEDPAEAIELPTLSAFEEAIKALLGTMVADSHARPYGVHVTATWTSK